MISITQVNHINGIVLLCFKIPLTTKNLNFKNLHSFQECAFHSLVYTHRKKVIRNAINPV